MKWFLLLCVVALTSTANLLLKTAALNVGGRGGDAGAGAGPGPLETAVLAAGQWRFWASIAALGLAFVLFAVSLKTVDLGVAYPFISSLTLAVVAALAVAVLGEPLTAYKVAGTALVVAGVVLLAL